MSLLSVFADEYHIPVIEDNQKIWFFRTKSGKFYHDFQTNNFIGLGWELVSKELITDQTSSHEYKREKIENLYPDEKRPGLILSQMDTFYNKMKEHDLVVIPSSGGKQIAIGRIGPVVDSIIHKRQRNEYEKCYYCHKRTVQWVKTVDSWQDIYLFKTLRAQQTISDITEEAKLVFRNLFPIYISGDSVHISFQKASTAELSLANNVDLQSGLLDIMDEVANLYGRESFRDKVNIKTAVGSPGFFEAILPHLPITVLSVCLIGKMVLGQIKGEDGSVASGLAAIITSINTLINDYRNRRKTETEIKQIEANTRLTDAQTNKTNAEAEKIKAEALLLNAQAKKTLLEIPSPKDEYEQLYLVSSGNTNVQESDAQEALTIASNEDCRVSICKLEQCAGRVCAAAAKCGLTYNGKKIDKIG